MKALLSPAKSLLVLRVMVSVCMIAHASQRFYFNSINGFGDFLNAKGFLIGLPLAWGMQCSY
ncbi:MAG: hypothetical protein EBR30_29560 [Cytophagia bacterium]|nr:hypothetical protein [Cytophagia bacterium]